MSKIVSNYLLLEVVGKGQFGEVFKARHIDTNNEFAIKMFDSSRVLSSQICQEMFIDEIQCLRRVRNRRIVRFHEWIKTTKHFYFVYELCSGGTLEDVISNLKKSPAITPSTQQSPILNEAIVIQQIFPQIVEGLLSIKSNYIIHNDIKPCNILLKQATTINNNNNNNNPISTTTSSNQNQISDVEITIADFGFSKYIGDQQSNSNRIIAHELTTSIRGSPIYMAPEVLKGSSIDYSSDVYSLGVLLFEMLQGTCPFEDTVLERLIAKKESCKLEFAKPISDLAQNLCRRMLEVDPIKRISIEEIAISFGIPLPQKLNALTRQQNEDERKSIKLELGLLKSGELSLLSNPSIVYPTPTSAESSSLSSTINTTNQLQQQQQAMITEVSERILCERNKVVYINNVLNAVLDLNLNEKSATVMLILLKQMANLNTKLLTQLRNSELCDFKISPSHWSKFRMTNDFDLLVQVLSIEQTEIQENFKSFCNQLPVDQLEQFERIESSLTSSTTNFTSRFHHPPTTIKENDNFTSILKDYCLDVREKIDQLNNSQSNSQIAYRLLMHLNNILDGFDIDSFFSNFMVKTIKRLSLQTYFRIITSLTPQDLLHLTNSKLNSTL